MAFPFFSWRRSPKVEQAHGAVPAARTPRPLDLDEYGNPPGDVHQLYAVKVPDPGDIELLYLVSHELASVIKRLVGEVWREPLEIVPDFSLKCMMCGHETDQDSTDCPKCHAEADRLRKPDESQRQILQKLQEDVNEEGGTLEEFGEVIEQDGNLHESAFVVLRYDYTLREDGTIDEAFLKELRAGDPRTFTKIRDPSGRMGGRAYVCLRCRNQDAYRPMRERGACNTCHGVTYDAWYAERDAGHGRFAKYYLKSEVVPVNLHYKHGSPVARLWTKLLVLHWTDKTAAWSLDPGKDKRPDKMLVVIGGNDASIEKALDRNAARRRKNPLALQSLHIPNLGVGPGTAPDAKVLDLGDTTFKEQLLEMRVAFKDDIREEYGLPPIAMGDNKEAGGLNNEGLQFRGLAQVVRAHQRRHRAWLDRVTDALGVTDYHFEFPDTLVEEESLDADTVQKLLDVAGKAAELGLTVKWENDQPRILDGPVKAKPAPTFPPIGGGGFGAPRPVPGVEMADAPRNSREVPEGVGAVLGGPSGAVAAEDVLYDGVYAGLTPELSRLVNEEVVASLTQPQGWSEDSIARRILPHLEAAGVENPEARARLIARQEAGSVISEWKRRLYVEEEAERGEQFLYRTVGPHDARRTKLSWWLEAQTAQGLTLPALESLLDAGIQLAKQGAFAQGGSHSHVQGEPIKLDAGYTRRGFVTHYGDRDTVVRIIGRTA